MPDFIDDIVEWICFEHQGYARQLAIEWWSSRSTAHLPNSVDEALAIIGEKGLAQAFAITVRPIEGERFPRIVNCELGPAPQRRTA